MIDPAEEQRIRALLRGGRRARRRAVHALFAATREPLYGLALRMTGRPDLADDAVQEAFLDVLRGVRSFRGDARLTTWLYRVALRAAARVAARAHRRSVDVLPTDLTDGAPSPPESTADLEGAARILRAIATLPPAQRAVVSLVAQHDLSRQELADVLGIPLGTVDSRLHEARANLRARLAGEDESALRAPLA